MRFFREAAREGEILIWGWHLYLGSYNEGETSIYGRAAHEVEKLVGVGCQYLQRRRRAALVHIAR